MKTYTNDLKGYIDNIKDLEQKARLNDERGLLAMLSFARKTAQDFLEKGNKE